MRSTGYLGDQIAIKELQDACTISPLSCTTLLLTELQVGFSNFCSIIIVESYLIYEPLYTQYHFLILMLSWLFPNSYLCIWYLPLQRSTSYLSLVNFILLIWDHLFHLAFGILILPARLSKFYKCTLYLSRKSLIKILTKISSEDLCTSAWNALLKFPSSLTLSHLQ